jgi:hypothetical protein
MEVKGYGGLIRPMRLRYQNRSRQIVESVDLVAKQPRHDAPNTLHRILPEELRGNIRTAHHSQPKNEYVPRHFQRPTP